MDVYRIPDRGGRSIGIHDVNVHVDQFGPLGRKYRRPEYFVCFSVRHNLDKPLWFTYLVGLAVLVHVKGGDLDPCPRSPCFLLGESYSAELRINEDPIWYYPIGCP